MQMGTMSGFSIKCRTASKLRKRYIYQQFIFGITVTSASTYIFEIVLSNLISVEVYLHFFRN